MADCYHPSLRQAQQRPLHTPQLRAYFTHKLPVQAYGKTSKQQTRMVSRKKKKRSISNYQSDFRKNRSITDSLIHFQCNIEKAIIRGEHTIVVFFDLTKAYDMTWKYGIMKKIYKEILTGHLAISIENFLTNRKI